MLLSLVENELRTEGLVVVTQQVTVPSSARVEFVDITDRVQLVVGQAGVAAGLAHVQSRHTTTGVVVNENEPLLLEDFRRRLETWAPERAGYRHDDLSARGNVPPGERQNAAAHLRALLLGPAESLAVVGGQLELGRWQRVFLVELDGPRTRRVTVTVLGRGAEPRPGSR